MRRWRIQHFLLYFIQIVTTKGFIMRKGICLVAIISLSLFLSFSVGAVGNEKAPAKQQNYEALVTKIQKNLSKKTLSEKELNFFRE